MNKPPIPRIIGISGKSGSGRDTVAELIRSNYYVKAGEPGKPEDNYAVSFYTIVHLADKIRDIVSTITNIPRAELDKRESKSIVVDFANNRTVAQLYQMVEDGMSQLISDNIWVASLLKSAGHDGLIIPDIRFPNELVAIESTGGIIIRVEGDQAGICVTDDDKRDLNHFSEVALDDFKFKYIIRNDGSLLDLKVKVAEVMTNIGIL